MTKRRVVVTGLGIVSPLGSSVASAWDGIRNGRSGIATLTKLDTSAFPVHIGGEVTGFNAEDYMSPKDVRKFDPFVPFGFAAGVQAFRDAGVTVTDENCARIGVAMGAGIGGLSTIEENAAKWLEAKSPRKISPFFIPGSIINAAAGQLSIQFGIRGPNLALVTACTTSTHSIGIAARCIQYGDADVMIAGGSESAFTPLGLGSFGQARALSLRNDAPARAFAAAFYRATLEIPGCTLAQAVLRVEADVLDAGEFSLVEGADHFGMKALCYLRQGWHDALVIDHHHLHGTCHQAQLLHQMVARHGDALAHQHLVARTAQPAKVDAVGAYLAR